MGLDSIRLNRDSPLRSSSFQDLVPGLAVRLSNCASIDRIDIVTDISRRPTRWVMEHAMPDYDVYAIKAPNGPNVDYNTSYATDDMHIGFDGKTGAFVNVVRFPENKQRHFIAGREIKLQGFNKPVEYYSPDYSKNSRTSLTTERRFIGIRMLSQTRTERLKLVSTTILYVRI